MYLALVRDMNIVITLFYYLMQCIEIEFYDISPIVVRWGSVWEMIETTRLLYVFNHCK